MDWGDRIEINPSVLVGKPVIPGTRLAVEFIVELLANRWSEQQIIENYPGVTHEDISACLRYAADVLKSERVYLAADKVMILPANENFPLLAVEALRAIGHNVLWTRTDMPGKSDDAILRQAQREDRLVITFDKDFGELAYR